MTLIKRIRSLSLSQNTWRLNSSSYKKALKIICSKRLLTEAFNWVLIQDGIIKHNWMIPRMSSKSMIRMHIPIAECNMCI